MVFDISTAKPVKQEVQGFDINTARPVEPDIGFTPNTVKEIQTLNGNPQQKESIFVEGANRTVELPKGGINRFFDLVNRSYQRGTETTELSELGSKVVFGDSSAKTLARITSLEKATEGAIPTEGWVEYTAQAIAEQIPQLLGMAQNVGEKGLAGTAGGAAMGFLAGGVGAPVGAAGGASIGAFTGVVEHSFRQITGSAFLEYSKFKDNEGNTLHPAAAKVGAVMTGMIGAGLEVLPFGLLFRMFPGTKQVFAKAGVKATEALKFPTTTQAMKTFLFNIASVMVAEGGTEVLQEDVQVQTGKILKEFSGREFEAITTEEYWNRIKEAGIKGAIVGGAITVPIAGARAAVDIAAKPAEEGVITEEAKLKRGVEAVKEEVKPKEVTEKTIVETAEKVEAVVKEVKEKATPEQITEVAETLKAIAPSKEAVDTITKGRIDKLDTDILNIDDQIDSTEKEIVQRKLKNQPVKALENKTDRLLKQREALDEQRAGLLTANDQISAASKLLTEKEVVAREVRKETIEVKGEKIVKLEEQSLKAQERALAKGLREGARLAKKDIKQAIKNTKQLIRESSLPKDTKDAIIAQFVTGETDFIKNIPKLKSKIATEFERLAVKEQKARITKSLSRKAIKPKIVAGVKQGKFNAQIQATLENLRTLNNISGKVDKDTGESEASRLLDQRIEKEIDDPLGNAVLNLKANPRSVTSPQIRAIANVIDILTSEGREAAKARVLARQIEAQAHADNIVEFVSKGENIKALKTTGAGSIVRSSTNFTRQILARLTDGWDDILDRILPTKEAQQLEIGVEIQKEKGIKRRMSNKLTKAAEEAYGIKDGRKLRNLLDQSSEVKDYGIFTNAKGEEVRLEMSVSQGRKLFMEWQDPTLRETLTSEDGNAYTQEMLTFVFNSILTEQDIQFALGQLEIYADFYDEINEVYSKVHGINLDKNEFYSPIRREVDGQEIGLDEFGRDQRYRTRVANNPSLKIRQKNTQPLMLRSDIEVYNRHITAMSRFIALREKTQLLNSIFGKQEVRRNLQAQYGRDFNLFIGEHLESFVNGGNRAADVLSRIINLFNRNFAAAQLGGKAKIGFTQLISYFAYAEFVPTSAFISGTRDFFTHMPTAIKTLMESELIKARGWSQEVEIARMGRVFDSKFLSKIQKKQDRMIDYMLMATKVGDRIPIFVGGWSVYKFVLKKTGNKQKAMQAFERATAKTQQSTDPDQMSLAQKTNPMMRGLTMFMSAPMAQFRGEARAIRQFTKGEINNRQFAKNILIYHFILPGLYQAIANGLIFGEWDTDDQIRAAILGSFNGIPILGEIFNATLRKIQGKESRGIEILKWTRPLIDMAGDLFESYEAGTEGDYEEMTEAIMDAFKNSGTLHGLPAPQINNIRKGLQDLEDGDLKASTLRFLGWPDGVINNIE